MLNVNTVLYIIVGRDSSVSTATRYRLEGLGIESRWGEIFHPHPNWPWGPPNLLTVGSRYFLGVKWLGHGVDHPSTSSKKVKSTLLQASWP
jgi:hypothetical protein